MAKSDVKAPAKEKEAKKAPVLGKAEITIAEKLVELLEYHNFVLKHYFAAPTVDFQQVYDSTMAIAPRLTRMMLLTILTTTARFKLLAM